MAIAESKRSQRRWDIGSRINKDSRSSRNHYLCLKQPIVAVLWVVWTLHDCFISCWKAQIRKNRSDSTVKTVINQNLRSNLEGLCFRVLLFLNTLQATQSSVRASAYAKTVYFGDNYLSSCTSELFFGLPERPFKCLFNWPFRGSCIQELYGGIHFSGDAIENWCKSREKDLEI